MNTSAKGNNYEWAIQRSFESKGYTTERAAGSHGPFDLIAWRMDGDYYKRLVWIQAKGGRLECEAADNAVLRLPDVPFGKVVLVHRCRGTCGRDGYLSQEMCLHERFPR